MEAVVGYCELPRAIDCCQRLLGEASKEKSENKLGLSCAKLSTA